ncbi:hypothetical protein GO988_18515 [Hymenobacter sp. HMF4947]|uniref:Uncharacterized protein n=1 Tax=Hymenobacter ginkgonis TaxID=2682976 RepID=A0A7K1TIU0_9BACT|nr:hypothetical protein [Hymenobacter ginkgonis]MVN78328.1 hypothetical protein [Hymenobacter ginkgonis]
MFSATEQWPLPGQVDPALSPCAFCRRRIVVAGKPVFSSCSCQVFGPPVTLAALAVGAVLASASLWWASRQSRGRG